MERFALNARPFNSKQIGKKRNRGGSEHEIILQIDVRPKLQPSSLRGLSISYPFADELEDPTSRATFS